MSTGSGLITWEQWQQVNPNGSMAEYNEYVRGTKLAIEEATALSNRVSAMKLNIGKDSKKEYTYVNPLENFATAQDYLKKKSTES
tara:strand:+ start:22428 stop:22682 length:255 start_codon:yes stop_codon:yes gene_type:complete